MKVSNITFLNKKYIFILLIFLGIYLNSCQEKSPDIVFSLDTSINKEWFYAEEGTYELTILTEDLWNISVEFSGNVESPWIGFSQETGEGDVVVYVSVLENTSLTERFAKITVSNSSDQKHHYVTQSRRTSGNTGMTGEWFEIPKDTSIANCVTLTHFLPENSFVRNYSMLYDKNLKLAYWVAYPLHSSYIGSSGRTDEWAYDPKIATTNQPTLFSGFAANQTDRGHQIPSADRTYSRAGNYTTFYFSNMTAQNSTLNQGIWANLESKIRVWMKSCDTIYVVTGAMPFTNTDKTITYVRDNEGKNVARPKYYFKALAQKKGNTYYTIAYKMDNAAPDYSNYDSYSLTVADLEKETGFTFFPLLDNAIKESINTGIWK